MEIHLYHYYSGNPIEESAVLLPHHLHASEYPESATSSMQKCVENNREKFTKDEFSVLNSLLFPETDYGNRMIAYAIINNK